MSWSFCSKGGGVFFVVGGIGLFYQWQGIFFAGVLDFFFSMAGDFWSKGICVFESIGEFYRSRV